MKTRNSTTIVIIVLTLSVVLWSCTRGDVRETPSGFKYSVVRKGDGRIVKPGEVLIMDMVIIDEADSLWHDCKLDPYPEMVKIQDESMIPMEHGLNETFRMLSKGDSIIFRMRAKDFFPLVWKTSPPADMDLESIFTARIGCREVLDTEGYGKFIKKLDSINFAKGASRYEQLEQTVANGGDQLTTDINIIDNFLKSKGVSAQSLPSGLRYILKAEGQGPTAVHGDFATMRYAGQTLDGREFDAGEYGFEVGAGNVIEGWDEIATIMKKGTALTVYIPSTLAYKHGGRPPVIMPDAILIFDMECLSIQKP